MEAIERVSISHDWITILLLLVMVILVITKKAFPQRFENFMLLFATDKYLVIQGRNPSPFHPFNLILFGVNIISVALFVLIFYRQLGLEDLDRPRIFFLRVATTYAAFVLLKFSVEKILSNIVSVDKELDAYLFYKLSYRNFLALALLPFSMLFTYVWEPNLTVLYICVGILLILNFITILGFFFENQRYLMARWFYFILYLCALEIGPYFILYKLITKL